MHREEILRVAKRMKPVVSGSDGKLYWIKPVKVGTIAFTWDPKKHMEAEGLVEVARIQTSHSYGHPSLVKPSMDECIEQCPLELRDRVVAFRTNTGTAVIDYDKGVHVCETTYYEGTLPEELKEWPVEW